MEQFDSKSIFKNIDAILSIQPKLNVQSAKQILHEAYHASRYYECIKEIIKETQDKLKPNETLLTDVILCDGSSIHVESFGFYNPYMITVVGTDKNNNTSILILNQENIQIRMTVIEKEHGKSYSKIGFHSELK